MLEKGVCYFGDKDIPVIIEEAFREVRYKGPKTTEQTLIDIWRHLVNNLVKPESISMGTYTYKGARMSNFDDIKSDNPTSTKNRVVKDVSTA